MRPRRWSGGARAFPVLGYVGIVLVLAVLVVPLPGLRGGSSAPSSSRSLTPDSRAGGWTGRVAQALPGAVEWLNLTDLSASTPPARAGAAAAFDPASDTFVMFGGTGRLELLSGSNPANDTWTYANASWSRVNASTPPPASEGDAAAYDPSRGAVVLVAVPWSPIEGPGAPSTWEFSGGTWHSLSTTGKIPATVYAAMSYDPAAGALVRFGGLGINGVGQEVAESATLSFANDSWVPVSTALSPPASYGSAMAYDPALQGIVEFGGESAGGQVRTGTWLFANSSWTQLTPVASPPGLVGATAAWDPVLGGIVLVGGSTDGGFENTYYSSNRTWLYRDGNWTTLATPLTWPGAVFAAGGYDPDLGGLVEFGGSQVGVAGFLVPRADTREAAHTPAILPSVANGPKEVGVPVAFGDRLASQAPPPVSQWNFGDGVSAAGWAENHTYLSAGSYVATLNASADVGGSLVSSVANVSLTVVPALTLQVGSLSTFTDPYQPVAFTATTAGGVAPYSIAWSFGDGRSASGSLSLRHAFNATGTYTVVATVTDALGVARAAPFVVHVEPFARVSVATASSIYDLGQTLSLSISTVNGSGPLTFAYEGLPPGCLSNGSRNLTCVPSAAGSYAVEAFVKDVDGVSISSNLLALEVFPALAGTLDTSARTIDLGESVVVNASFASVGSGNVSLALSSELGCPSAVGLAVTCTPTVAGTYPVVGEASDAAGGTTSLQGGVLTVNPPVLLAGTGPTAAVPITGSYELALAASGGTPPYRYAFLDLPSGCAALTATHLRCSALALGVHEVRGVVIDATGANATVRLAVDVVAPPGASPVIPPPSGSSGPPGGWLFWLVVAAAVAEIGFSVRYSRRPRRRRGPTVRKGLWSDFGSPRPDAADEETPAAIPVPG